MIGGSTAMSLKLGLKLSIHRIFKDGITGFF